MTVAPDSGVPPLAGLAGYQAAARIGYSVEDTVLRLLRYQWAERRLLTLLLAFLPAEPVWEAKGGFALHQWQGAEHVDWIRRRIGEMRHPIPSLDNPPDARLDALFDEARYAGDTVERLAGTYRVIRRALAEAYARHLSESNPLVDHPTRRVLRRALLDHEEALEWGGTALAALVARDPAAATRAGEWEAHLRVWLEAAGGIAGPPPERDPALPASRGVGRHRPDSHPRRDDRFHGRYRFDFPPHVVYSDPRVPADERNLALLCKRTLEMDVPEMMATILLERPEQPWEFHLDYSRQLWDEMRHAMMGSVALEARGVDWTRIPLNVGFSLRLNLHADPLERQIMLYGIEQSLMPAETGKRYEFQTAVEAGDPLSAHFHDYDWADEVLHAQIGRRWLRREGIDTEEAMARTQAIHQRTWAELDRYREPEPPGDDWWDSLVRQVLGKPSALPPDQRRELRILAE